MFAIIFANTFAKLTQNNAIILACIILEKVTGNARRVLGSVYIQRVACNLRDYFFAEQWQVMNMIPQIMIIKPNKTRPH